MTEISKLKKDLLALQTFIASIGRGYWTKKPCSFHARENRFALECLACNAKNAEFVLLDESRSK